jgi:hypothetical protein
VWARGCDHTHLVGRLGMYADTVSGKWTFYVSRPFSSLAVRENHARILSREDCDCALVKLLERQ